MHPDKLLILQKKLDDFLSLPPEIKHSIDTNSSYDGIFDILDELSEVAESHNVEIHDYDYSDIEIIKLLYNIEDTDQTFYNIISYIDYYTTKQSCYSKKANNAQNLIDISEDYAWAA